MSRKLFRIIWLIIFVPSTTLAQVYNVSTFQTSDGLSQSQVRSILQDSRGFVWLGTQRGLSKFDGKNFENFQAQSATGPNEALAGNFIGALFEDNEGKIWIGTEQGASTYDGNKFTRVKGTFFSQSRSIEAFTQDSKGRVWIGTEKGGLQVWEEGLDSARQVDWLADLPIRELNINVLFRDRSDIIWMGTNRGLYQFEGEQISARSVPGATMIRSIIQDQEGNMWIGTDQGAYCFTEDWKTFEQFKPEGSEPTVYALAEDNDHSIWLGTNEGVSYIKNKEIVPYREDDPVLRYRISAISADFEGNIWLGTDGGGLRKITKGVFESLDISRGLSSNLAKSFLEYPEGQIWISTFDRGVNVWSNNSSPVLHYGVEEGLSSNDICTSFRDSQGRLWFATYNGGLSCYDKGKFINYTIKDGLVSNQVFCITEDLNGLFWIGTDNGLMTWDEKQFAQYSGNDTLNDNVIYSLHADSQGKVWVGTRLGVNYIENGKAENFNAPDDIGRTVISILEDKQQRVWFATANGIYLYHQSHLSPRISISEAPGANNVVSVVLDDNQGIWFGTGNGAYRLDLTNFVPPETESKFKFIHYTDKDGLPNLECNANAAFKDSQGNIWFGTAGGPAFHPVGSVDLSTRVPPKVHITAVRTARDIKDDDVDPRTGLPRNMKLPHAINSVEFEYIGISLKSPRQVEYKYKLEGLLNADWSKPTRQNSIAFSNLSSGDYVFKVHAKKETEKWEDASEASYSFSIQKAIWEQLWFQLLAGLMVAGLAGLVYWRISADRKRTREEQAVKDRAERLQLEHQALYAMMNPHFTFNALQSIQYFIHRQDRIKANKFLSSFAKLIRKNLESTRSEFISLSEEVERLRLYLSLEQMRFPEKFDYQIEVSQDIDQQDTMLPPMILQPFVENAIKHGIMPLESGGKVTLDVELQDEDHLRFLIRDNGIGIETSKQQREGRPKDHVSRGMQITQDRLALFARMTHSDYDVDIREVKNEEQLTLGTEVKIVLPLHIK